ncbi:ergothioneine biosynthesis glutamate--cysteine ligase EgtA [Actinoplanes sp. NPDC051633]|uniref:ergothioneine biosynthesis glutamate--cysteine ligase EgtA n=1 Tax=Actinoplanes sp. NPDC051633 TaxID=3155670 RepID=UPI00342D4967
MLRTQEDVEARIRAICFKTGPPTHIGAELEWTVHHSDAPAAPLRAADLRRALGRHTPATLDPSLPPDPLPALGSLTAEPGGQLEISSAPATSLGALHTAVSTDVEHLTQLLTTAGLTLGRSGIDPHRRPHRLIHNPRYDAMERAFDADGPHGRVMMNSTAGLQVCLDAGPPDQLPARWAAVTALGPVLVAAFANARRHAGRDTGWASARMAAWLGIDPRRSHPFAHPPGDPAAGWVRFAMAAPLLCAGGATLGDWLRGALPGRPTEEDVDFHLSTLFPPVRPRGYLEIRYLDAQPGADWIAPVAVLAVLLADPATTEAALELARPVADRWVEASRCGLADPPIRRAATRVLDLACRRLGTTDLPPGARQHVITTVEKRLRDAEEQS